MHAYETEIARLRDKIKEHLQAIANLKKALADDGDCTHAVTERFTWEYDNGYSKSEWRTGIRCLSCDAEEQNPIEVLKFRSKK